jgi:Mrp family chromosome partitioning ATPase
MSRIFKALERAETEGRQAPMPSLQPSEPAESEALPELDLPEARSEYDHLRVALALASNGAGVKSVMFVSALPGEGVSTVTLGFACAVLEIAPRGVLVVEANFARPSLASRLGVMPGAGLTEVLAKEVTRADAVQVTPVQRLFFLGTGRRPLDLSRSQGLLDELAADLKSTYDYIIFDGGSLQGRSEALLFAGRVDAVSLVIQAERTGTDSARDAVAQLRRAGANISGTILNRRREHLPGFLARRL